MEPVDVEATHKFEIMYGTRIYSSLYLQILQYLKGLGKHSGHCNMYVNVCFSWIIVLTAI